MRIGPLSAVVVLALTATGCTTAGPDTDGESPDPEGDASVYDDVRATEVFDDARFRRYFQAQARLPDGRRIRLWFPESGDRLLEQHYSPGEQAWTTPQVVVRSTEPHPCQGIDIVEDDGVVAVIADFGMWCYEGEPPQQSVAAVATGDLTDWAADVADGFDGWQRVTLEAEQVEWTGHDRSLTWAPDEGFSSEADDAES